MAQQGKAGGNRIAKLDQTKLREGAYEAIRDAFTRGEFAPGETLSLRTLADELGISMTPVREAVRRLVAEGALVDTPSRKLVVPPFDIKRMLEVRSARLSLEAMILDLAMQCMDDSLFAELEAILASPQTEPGKPDPVRNRSFHFTLYRRSKSEVLLPMVEALWMQHGAYLNLVFQHEGAREVVEDLYHDELVRALKERDRSSAQAALRADIARSFDLLLESVGAEK